MKHRVALFFALTFCCPLFGQKSITHQPQYWLRYSASLNFPSKINLLTDAESRRFFKVKGFAAGMLRSQLQVPLKQDFFFDVAAACFYFYGQHFSETELESRPPYLDIRFHQSILKRYSSGKWSLVNRLRLEERMVQQDKASGSNNFKVLPRLRLGLLLNYSLHEKWEIRAANDVIFNVFQKKTPNVFERNNFSLGLFHKLSASTGVEISYMNQFIQRPGLLEYLQRDNIRLFVLQNFSVKNGE